MKKIFTLFTAAAMTAIAAQAQETAFTFYHGEQALENEASYSVGYTEEDGFYTWDANLKIGFNWTVTAFLYEVTSTGGIQTCPELPGAVPGTCFPVAANEPRVIDLYKNATFDEETPIGSLGIHLADEVEIISEPIEVKVRAYEDGWEDEAVNVTVTFGTFDQSSVKVEKADASYVRVNGSELTYNVEDSAVLTVCDASGRQVLSAPVSGNGSVSLASLPAGLYIYRAGTISGKAMLRK